MAEQSNFAIAVFNRGQDLVRGRKAFRSRAIRRGQKDITCGADPGGESRFSHNLAITIHAPQAVKVRQKVLRELSETG